MPYVTQLAYSDKSSSNPDMINDLVGQVKNFLVNNSTLVTVISDNNPPLGSGTYRIVDLRIGNSGHYLRVYAYSITAIEFQVRNLANSNYVGTYVRPSSVNNVTMYLVHGNNVLAFRYGPRYICCFAEDTTGNMWAQISGYPFTFYPYNSNTGVYFAAGTPYRRTTAGDALLPGRAAEAEVYCPTLYAFNNQDSNPAGTVYQDATGYYYMLIGSGSSATLGGATVYPAILAREG